MLVNTTNAMALALAREALAAGHILHVSVYSGTGTLTGGPNRNALGWGMPWAVHAYFPRGRGNWSEEGDVLDVTSKLLEWCGRGNLGRAARKALGRLP